MLHSERVDSVKFEGNCAVIAAGSQGKGHLFWGGNQLDKRLTENLEKGSWSFSIDCIVSWDDVFNQRQQMIVFLNPSISGDPGTTLYPPVTGKLEAYNQRHGSDSQPDKPA
jgi:hypothetical protein